MSKYLQFPIKYIVNVTFDKFFYIFLSLKGGNKWECYIFQLTSVFQLTLDSTLIEYKGVQF